MKVWSWYVRGAREENGARDGYRSLRRDGRCATCADVSRQRDACQRSQCLPDMLTAHRRTTRPRRITRAAY